MLLIFVEQNCWILYPICTAKLPIDRSVLRLPGGEEAKWGAVSDGLVGKEVPDADAVPRVRSGGRVVGEPRQGRRQPEGRGFLVGGVERALLGAKAQVVVEHGALLAAVL